MAAPEGPTSSGSRPTRWTVRQEALAATVYDIVPTIAAPHGTSINAVTATPDLRWVFSGGADGYIRKFDWVDTVNGKAMLTVAQRHPFVDSVTKAGVLLSYWENDEPPPKSPTEKQADDELILSPVYSLAVHEQALWILSGLESGGINLQSVRHDEGKRIWPLKKHTSAVSALTLAEDEKSVLSGSWDKAVYDWDLNTGSVRQEFLGSGGQISAVERRPASSIPVPEVTEDAPRPNGTFQSYGGPPRLTNGVVGDVKDESDDSTLPPNGPDQSALPAMQGSPANSLFSEPDSLFGGDFDDKSGGGGGGGGMGGLPGASFGDDEDDEFSRAIANGFQQQDNEMAANDEMHMNDVGAHDRSSETLDDRDGDPFPSTASQGGASDTTLANADEVLPNGLMHTGAEDVRAPNDILSLPPLTSGAGGGGGGGGGGVGVGVGEGGFAQDPSPNPALPSLSPSRNAATDTTFLAASMDGTLRIWDRRQPNPVATILPRNVPPWCMNACWAPDGNTIYAGRRNGTVEEYSMHKGLRQPDRVFKFPQGSGPVSAVKAMPNGRHLVCASLDILRLYDLRGDSQQQPHPSTSTATPSRHGTVPFLIVPGHRGGVISTLYTDPTCRYLLSAAGNRGWEGSTTEVLLGYEIGCG